MRSGPVTPLGASSSPGRAHSGRSFKRPASLLIATATRRGALYDMAKKPAKKTKKTSKASTTPPVTAAEPVSGPHFAQPDPTSDPTAFHTAHASDTAAYKVLDKEAGTLKPLPFPPSRG